ncbi:hypothetical protein NQ314_016898 [Rhamnusium bicolor]|uniref:PiggyBac transposable element-derived protein domain-containing protein n=1 Tax=Rhamnusium bicolor TaxID=1586634 RepID=A0AAV8WVP4_9CUCU|nr:hypothetical protein NQ314_016898 [Rhamnusium bicolor]
MDIRLESGDEDAGGYIDNLNGQQYLAQAEIRLANNSILGGDEAFLDNDMTYTWPGIEKITWIDGDLVPLMKSFPSPNFHLIENMSNLDIFEKFIDHDIMSFLVEQTTNYALFLNHPDPKLTLEEMKVIIAILIVTGYNELPGKDLYWDSEDDMRNHMVYNEMRRDRFRQIIRYLHCADTPEFSRQNEKFGKCAAPPINMIDEFPLQIKNLPYKFYFDNLFTGLNLLHHLKERGCHGTGTIRENRMPKSCQLPQKSVLEKSKERGEFVSAIDREDGIIIVKWMDNNIVTAGSTCHGISPITQVKRYSQREKKIVQVQRP